MTLAAQASVSDTSPTKARTVCGVVFNSRTLDSSGNPKTSKEYLCNFCQFKSELHQVFNRHLSSHIFSCNHCNYKAFTRYEVITHKRDQHPNFRHELAGFEGFGLDDNAIQQTSLLNTSSSSITPITITSSPVPKSPIIVAPPSTQAHTSIATVTEQPHTSIAAVTKQSKTSIAGPSISGAAPGPPGQKGGSYFTYKIVHNATTGKPQSYECDICRFRTPNLSDMYSHAATHTLADLQKKGTDNIMWECFYCSFNAGKQNDVVEHVTKKHPGKPIQLKRYASGQAEKTITTEAELDRSADPLIPPDKIKTEKKDKDEETPEEDNCLWGCTYCKTQVPKREAIIEHVRKEHAGKKLVITRRRMNRGSKTDDDKKEKRDKEKKREKQKLDKSDNDRSAKESEDEREPAKVKEKEKSPSKRSSAESERPGKGRSRRKQTVPRKVRDSSIDSEPGEVEKKTEESPLPVTEPSNDEYSNHNGDENGGDEDDDDDNESLGNPTPEQLNLQISEPISLSKFGESADSSSQDKMDSPEPSKEAAMDQNPTDFNLPPQLKFKSKYDMLIAMMNRDNVDNEKEIRELARDASPVISQTINMPRAGQTKSVLVGPPMVSLLKGKNLRNLLTKPIPGKEDLALKQQQPKDMEIEYNDEEAAANADVVFLDSIPDDLQIDHSQHYVHNRNKMTAKCNLCSHTTEGKHCLAHIKEHVMIHTGERLWGCPYCDFKCNRRISMFKHVKSRHPSEPVRLIRRKPYQHLGQRNKKLQVAAGIAYRGVPTAASGPEKRENRLRGPRSVREKKTLQQAKHMWQCPHCPRQSVFYGTMKIHVKLVHPQNYPKDGGVSFVRQVRPCGSPDRLLQQNRIWLKNAKVHIVRHEDMPRFPILGQVLDSKGETLLHDLDIEEEQRSPPRYKPGPKSSKIRRQVSKPKIVTPASESRNKYGCSHCEHRAARPALVKEHMIETHPGKAIEIVDMRVKSQRRERHLYMCKFEECDFQSFLKEALYAHIGKNPEHYYDENMPTGEASEKGGTTLDPILKITSRCSSLRPRGGKSIEPDHIDVLLDAADTYMGDDIPPVLEPVGGESTPIKGEGHAAMGHSKEHETSTPILTPPGKSHVTKPPKSLDLNGVELKCRYCDFLNGGEPITMKDHLTSAHPGMDPMAIDVVAKEKRRTARVFICQLLFCNFAT